MPDEPERVIREVTFAVEGDGRTIEARIVPYNTPTQVVDSPANGGTGVPYLERWLPGVFDKQAKALDKIKVLLNFEHGRGIGNVVGHAVALREDPDALYGTFRVHPGPDGDKALHMVNEGVLTGLSVEALPRRSNRTSDGIVERVKATLENVALVRRGAYEDALVLAVREAPEPDDPSLPEPEDPQPDEPVPDPARASEIDEVLKRMGIEPLVRIGVSTRTWNPSPSRFTDEEYERAALVTRTGGTDPKTNCSLPVLEPTGEVNTNALSMAAARLSTVTGITPAQRATAARKLVRYYRQADMEVPENLRALASR